MAVSSVDQMVMMMASNLVDCSDSTKDEKMASWTAPSSDDSMEMMMEDCSDSTKDEKMASWTAPSSDDSMEMMMEDCSDSTKAQTMASWTALSLDDLMEMTRERLLGFDEGPDDGELDGSELG